MPYNDPDPDDPSVLVGVQLPASEETETEMAYVFAEEFARLGFTEERLLALFRHPFYAGANRAWHVLGEEKIQSIVRETLEFWNQFRLVIEDAPEDKQWDVSLNPLRPASNAEPRTSQNEEHHESSL